MVTPSFIRLPSHRAHTFHKVYHTAHDPISSSGPGLSSFWIPQLGLVTLFLGFCFTQGFKSLTVPLQEQLNRVTCRCAWPHSECRQCILCRMRRLPMLTLCYPGGLCFCSSLGSLSFIVHLLHLRIWNYILRIILAPFAWCFPYLTGPSPSSSEITCLSWNVLSVIWLRLIFFPSPASILACFPLTLQHQVSFLMQFILQVSWTRL